MLDLADQGKVYTRDDINGISNIMGYSVWNRPWWLVSHGQRSEPPPMPPCMGAATCNP
jgi:hypothetical protein